MSDPNGKKLRIAIFSDSALPILNGVSISIDMLVRELRNRGHSVHIYTASHFGYRDTDPNTFRFRAFETPWTKGYPLALPPFIGMLRRFRNNTYDIIHTHTPYTIGFVGLRWAQSHNIPIVATYHTLYDRYAHYIPYFPRRYVRFKIAKHTNYYYNRVNHVITPSRAAQKWLRRHAVETPISVIPTGTPSGGMLNRAEIRASLGLLPEHRALLYVGRIAKEKNLDTLLDMAKLVFSKEPHARLFLVGDGPYRQGAAEYARQLAIGDRVTFVGFVLREEVDKYYAASDLFTFSSISETQGLVVQEAMAHGLPAVVVSGGGAGEAVEDGANGYLVPNEPEIFSQTVLELLQNADLIERLSQGARRSTRGHTPQDMAEDVLSVYEYVLAQRVAGEISADREIAIPIAPPK